MTAEMDDVTMVTNNGEEENEEKLWNMTDKLVKKFYNLGKECIFLSVDEDSLQYRCTNMGNRFLASEPKWSQVFRDFCVNLYSTGLTSIQENDAAYQDSDAAADDDCIDITEEEEVTHHVNPGVNIDITEKEEVTHHVNPGVNMKFTIIKSGRNKRKVKLASKDYKVEPTVSKEQQDDAAIETRPTRTLNRFKEKHPVLEKTGKRLTSRSCSKQSVVHKTRNQTRRSAEMFKVDEILKSNETLPGEDRKTDCSVSKKKENFLTRSGSNSKSLKGDNKILESRKLELNVLERKENDLTDKESNSESLKGDNEIDTQESLKGDNKIDTQESLKGDNEESLAEVKDESVAESSNKSKARLNEEARYNKLHPDLQELWQYLNKLNFICKICSKEYDNTVSYYNHIRCHKDVQHCKICDVFIPKEPESMEKHKAEKHGDGLIFRCLKCCQRFKSKLGLKNHFICNHADNVVRFKCQICGARCGNLSMLTRHERIHEFENSCFICLEKIDTKEKLKQHMKDIHGYYLCTTCSLYFVDHAVLEEHVQTHFKSETNLASNTASLADTNSTSGTENGNTSNQSKNELNISDLDKNMTERITENIQKGFLNEQTTREKVEKLDIDLDCEDEILISEMTVTKDKSLESTESNENQKSTLAGEIKISTESGEIQISNQVGEIKISTKADVNQISTKARENQKQCKFCGKIFKQRHALLRHMKLHNNRSDFTCEHCGKICKTDETFKRHMKLHLPNDEKPFSCDVCGKGFPTRTNLNIHSIVHNEENTYICEYCGKGFRSPRQLKIHNRSHTGEEPYQCTECNKKFRSWDMLDCHKITHKPKSVICDICGKFFAHRLRLRSHKKSHDKVGRYICIFDKLRFKSVGNLNSHYVAKHLNYAKQKGWLLHQCEHCDKVLPTKEKYQRHVRTHTGEKPYECDICKKSFAENGNLTAHMKIHNNDKPYKCTFCNKRFIQRRTLKKHILIHEQPADSLQEKNNEESTRYTKDQLLALSIVAGSQNYMEETGNNVPVAEKKSEQTADNRYVVIIPEGHVFQQVPELNVERTPLLPVRFSDIASVSPGQFSSSLVNFNQQEYMAFSQHSEQMTPGQFIHSNSIRLAHQSKRIPIETVQQVKKIGHITEQQAQSNEHIFIDPMSYTEHTLTTSSAL